jgi:hypothetical protein
MAGAGSAARAVNAAVEVRHHGLLCDVDHARRDGQLITRRPAGNPWPSYRS